jgi:hypothetical protein
VFEEDSGKTGQLTEEQRVEGESRGLSLFIEVSGGAGRAGSGAL